MNNKGFMMAEVVVVASIIIVALTAFFVNYSSLVVLYNERLNYYDPTLLYELAKYRDSNYTNLSVSSSYKTITYNGKTIYFLKVSQLNSLKSNVSNKTYKKYLEYLEHKIDNTDNYKNILVTEKCATGNTNCKYAYLEVMVR